MMNECLFTFYAEFIETYKHLNDEGKDGLKFLMDIINYGLYGTVPAEQDYYFTVAKRRIDFQKVRHTNGKKGGRPRKATAENSVKADDNFNKYRKDNVQ